MLPNKVTHNILCLSYSEINYNSGFCYFPKGVSVNNKISNNRLLVNDIRNKIVRFSYNEMKEFCDIIVKEVVVMLSSHNSSNIKSNGIGNNGINGNKTSSAVCTGMNNCLSFLSSLRIDSFVFKDTILNNCSELFRNQYLSLNSGLTDGLLKELNKRYGFSKLKKKGNTNTNGNTNRNTNAGDVIKNSKSTKIKNNKNDEDSIGDVYEEVVCNDIDYFDDDENLNIDSNDIINREDCN